MSNKCRWHRRAYLVAPVFMLIGREKAGTVVPPGHQEVEDAGKEEGSGPARLEVKTVGNRYSWATSRNQRSQPIQRRRHSLSKGVKTLNG